MMWRMLQILNLSRMLVYLWTVYFIMATSYGTFSYLFLDATTRAAFHAPTSTDWELTFPFVFGNLSSKHVPALTISFAEHRPWQPTILVSIYNSHWMFSDCLEYFIKALSESIMDFCPTGIDVGLRCDRPMTFLTDLATNATSRGIGVVLYSGNNDALIPHRGTES